MEGAGQAQGKGGVARSMVAPLHAVSHHKYANTGPLC